MFTISIDGTIYVRTDSVIGGVIPQAIELFAKAHNSLVDRTAYAIHSITGVNIQVWGYDRDGKCVMNSCHEMEIGMAQ